MSLFSLCSSPRWIRANTAGTIMSLSTTQHKKHQEHAISIRAEGSEPPEEPDQAQGLLTHGLGVGGGRRCDREYVSLHIGPTDAARRGWSPPPPPPSSSRSAAGGSCPAIALIGTPDSRTHPSPITMPVCGCVIWGCGLVTWLTAAEEVEDFEGWC